MDTSTRADSPAPADRKRRATSDKEKRERKTARMERNRVAAQVSRDRKKEHSAFLEARVAELEERLSSESATSPTPSTAFTVVTDTARIDALEAENALLRARLESESAASSSLQARLDAMEAQVALLVARAPPVDPPAPDFDDFFSTTPLEPAPASAHAVVEELEGLVDDWLAGHEFPGLDGLVGPEPAFWVADPVADQAMLVV